jgi:hypothetical protein
MHRDIDTNTLAPRAFYCSLEYNRAIRTIMCLIILLVIYQPLLALYSLHAHSCSACLLCLSVSGMTYCTHTH